jgi:hypothetical protein
MTAATDGDELDIRCESIYVSISKEDILRNPTAGAFISAWIMSILQDANK